MTPSPPRPRHRLELREADATGELVAMDAAEAAALVASKLVTVTPWGAGTWRVVPAGNKVGAVRIGEWEVSVRPKAPFASVLFMLAYASDPGIAPEEFEGAADEDLWAMVAHTLQRLVGRALAQGVLQGYVTRDDQLSVVRGRIRVGDQMARRQGRPLPLELRFDEYKTDIPENRILRTALRRMGQVPGVPGELRRRLSQLEARLADVTVLRAGQWRPAWSATRLNRRYVPALHLSELVLDHLGLSTVHGDRPVASFVIDMAQTFERFVTAAVTRGYAERDARTGGWTTAQFRTFLDTEHLQRIRPDIVHLNAAGVPDAVLDVKYKLMGGPVGPGAAGAASSTGATGAGPRLEDLYQMLAYCTVLGLDRGTLIYAAESADAQRTTLEVAGSNVRITAWPVDVAVPPHELIVSITAHPDRIGIAIHWSHTFGVRSRRHHERPRHQTTNGREDDARPPVAHRA